MNDYKYSVIAGLTLEAHRLIICFPLSSSILYGAGGYAQSYVHEDYVILPTGSEIMVQGKSRIIKNPYPAWVQYTGSTPSPGDIVGVIAGSDGKVSAGYIGYTVLAVAGDLVYIQPNSKQKIITGNYTGESLSGVGNVDVYTAWQTISPEIIYGWHNNGSIYFSGDMTVNVDSLASTPSIIFNNIVMCRVELGSDDAVRVRSTVYTIQCSKGLITHKPVFRLRDPFIVAPRNYQINQMRFNITAYPRVVSWSFSIAAGEYYIIPYGLYDYT